ncbi:hypothetical protein JOD54_002131 [Actinokineospora baliensis]|uniref:hypothetical protein n=1 Tax=Actinokineospora baliensis TaxID=547056 RepID=UPI0019594239|nr:hypothetical protein [Actinokineospora baliensis]MBM7771927.1 hypothetical protein [Actinokineospora baliensis]
MFELAEDRMALKVEEVVKLVLAMHPSIDFVARQCGLNDFDIAGMALELVEEATRQGMDLAQADFSPSVVWELVGFHDPAYGKGDYSALAAAAVEATTNWPGESPEYAYFIGVARTAVANLCGWAGATPEGISDLTGLDRDMVIELAPIWFKEGRVRGRSAPAVIASDQRAIDELLAGAAEWLRKHQ